MKLLLYNSFIHIFIQLTKQSKTHHINKSKMFIKKNFSNFKNYIKNTDKIILFVFSPITLILIYGTHEQIKLESKHHPKNNNCLYVK